MDQRTIARLRAELEARRAELTRGSATTVADRDPVALDQQSVGRLSRMDAIQQQAMALEAERRRQGNLRRIEAALERIAAGTYGECTACGEPIGPKRLDLDPAVPTCIACAGRG